MATDRKKIAWSSEGWDLKADGDLVATFERKGMAYEVAAILNANEELRDAILFYQEESEKRHGS